jgi:hypothetical protein
MCQRHYFILTRQHESVFSEWGASECANSLASRERFPRTRPRRGCDVDNCPRSGWTDGREERILYVTPGYRLVALDAKTGALIPNFGQKGLVDLKLDDDQVIDPMSSEIGLHATPIVANDVVIVGAAGKSGGVPAGKTNIEGYVRGFDVRTGKRLWTFHTIPKPGEFGTGRWPMAKRRITSKTIRRSKGWTSRVRAGPARSERS